MREVSRTELKALGLKLDALSKVNGVIEFEPTVALGGSYRGRCRFGCYTYVGVGSNIVDVDFGRFCSIGANVRMGGTQHPMSNLSTHPFMYDGSSHFRGLPEYEQIKRKLPKPVRPRTVIEDDVWIGDNVVVMSGIRIGTGAVVGAGSVVTRDVAPYTIVGGVPAKVIKRRFDEDLSQRLMNSRWWDYRFWEGGDDMSDIDRLLGEVEEGRYPLNPIKRLKVTGNKGSYVWSH